MRTILSRWLRALADALTPPCERPVLSSVSLPLRFPTLDQMERARRLEPAFLHDADQDYPLTAAWPAPTAYAEVVAYADDQYLDEDGTEWVPAS